jgi:hypothetical protein
MAKRKMNHDILFYRDIGPRSKVWSEKEFVDAAAFEFSEVEIFYFDIMLSHVCILLIDFCTNSQWI